ncbi:MAG: hypothetical protein ACOC5M_00245 [Chloroflexota bacterium]
MASISELVTFQLAQTEQDLQSSSGLSNYGEIKSAAIERAKHDLYGASVPSEAQIGDVVRYYLSDVAVVYLIDSAIDWYQSQTVQSQSAGDEQYTYHDRVSNLRQRRRELQNRISDAVDKIKTLALGSGDVGDLASMPLAQAQADGRSKVTNDPWKWARYLYGDLVKIDDGVRPKTMDVDRP